MTSEGKVTEEELYRTIGRNVRAVRRAREMNQADVAGKACLLRTSIANIEAGKQRVPIHTLLRIASALDTSLSSLLPVEDAPYDLLGLAYNRIDDLEKRLERIAALVSI